MIARVQALMLRRLPQHGALGSATATAISDAGHAMATVWTQPSFSTGVIKMSEFTIDELLAQFDEAVRPKVLSALDAVQGLAVYRKDDKVKALALTPEPEQMLDDGFALIG